MCNVSIRNGTCTRDRSLSTACLQKGRTGDNAEKALAARKQDEGFIAFSHQFGLLPTAIH